MRRSVELCLLYVVGFLAFAAAEPSFVPCNDRIAAVSAIEAVDLRHGPFPDPNGLRHGPWPDPHGLRHGQRPDRLG